MTPRCSPRRARCRQRRAERSKECEYCCPRAKCSSNPPLIVTEGNAPSCRFRALAMLALAGNEGVVDEVVVHAAEGQPADQARDDGRDAGRHAMSASVGTDTEL